MSKLDAGHHLLYRQRTNLMDYSKEFAKIQVITDCASGAMIHGARNNGRRSASAPNC
jgi:hypothetical protein